MELSVRNFWFEFKSWIREASGFSTDDAHIHVGMALFLVGAIVLRHRKNGFLIAWLMVFFAQTLNEVLDARDWIMWTGTINWPEMAKDYVLTLFWPGAVCLLMTKMSRDFETKA